MGTRYAVWGLRTLCLCAFVAKKVCFWRDSIFNLLFLSCPNEFSDEI